MFFLFLLCFASFLYAYYVWRKTPDSDNEPPMLPGALPIVGHTYRVIGNSIKLWNRLCVISKQCHALGGVVKNAVGPAYPCYVITDPEDYLTVANTCLEKDDLYAISKKLLGEGLATSKLSKWKIDRKLLNPAFSQTVLDGFLGVLNSQARKLVKDLENEVGKGMFNHYTYTRDNALKTICLTAMGVDLGDQTFLNSQYINAIDEMMRTLTERVQKFWLLSYITFKWSGLKRTQDKCIKILHNMSNTVLQKRKSEMNNIILTERNTGTGLTSEKKFKPFMDLLLELAIECQVFNDREIQDHVNTVIAAGHDTSASILMYTMLLLGTYPEVQEKAYTEIEEIFEGADSDVGKYDLSKLVYVEAILKESMRVYTLVPVTGRKLDRNVKLKNYTLAAGRSCIAFLFEMHKHPMWGPDAHKFNPDRWLSPDTLPASPNCFVSFGLGKRACIGKAYAYMSLKTSLVHLIRNYRFHGDISKLVLKIDVVLKPVSGNYISIEKRK